MTFQLGSFGKESHSLPFSLMSLFDRKELTLHEIIHCTSKQIAQALLVGGFRLLCQALKN